MNDMPNLTILKQASVDKLRKNIGDNFSRYEKTEPDWERFFDTNDYARETGIELCGNGFEECFETGYFSDLIEDKILDDEPARCEAIYKALKNLTPQQATDGRVWTYLTHFVFWEYARARWPFSREIGDKKKKKIESHFFLCDLRGMVRDNAISRLWWMAHVCSRFKSCELGESLSALLYKEDARKEIMERATFCRSEPIFNSLMKFILESYRGNKELHQRGKFRDLCKQLNRIGGISVLDSLTQSELDNKVERIIKEME